MKEFFDTVLTDQFSEAFTVASAVTELFIALGLGLLISLTYIFTSKRNGYLPAFAASLIILPAVSATIILIIHNSILLALGVAGSFSMVRFRTTFPNPKDTVFVFFALTTGMVVGTGYTQYALMFAVIVNICTAVLYLARYSEGQSRPMLLRMSVENTLDYEAALKPIFDECTCGAYLKRITQGGCEGVYTLNYLIRLKKGLSEKEFIEKISLSCGSSDASLTMREFEDKVF